jgi:hypothetical protein
VSLRRSSDTVMRPLRLTALSAALLLAACMTQPPRQAETYYFDCDVPEGRFAEWNRTVRGSEVHVSGSIELIEPRRDPTWRPVANVFVSGEDPSFYAGLRLSVDGDSQDSVQVSLIGSTGAAPGDALISRPWRGERIPFSLVLTRSGELTVRAGDGSRAVHVSPFAPQNVRLSCSTGQFKYRDVSVDVPK